MKKIQTKSLNWKFVDKHPKTTDEILDSSLEEGYLKKTSDFYNPQWQYILTGKATEYLSDFKNDHPTWWAKEMEHRRPTDVEIETEHKMRRNKVYPKVTDKDISELNELKNEIDLLRKEIDALSKVDNDTEDPFRLKYLNIRMEHYLTLLKSKIDDVQRKMK